MFSVIEILLKVIIFLERLLFVIIDRLNKSFNDFAIFHLNDTMCSFSKIVIMCND